MAISAGASIEFFGTEDLVTDGSTVTIPSGSYLNSNDVAAWTNDDDAPMAAVIMRVDLQVTPSAGASIGIYTRLQDIDSTNDQAIPDANFEHYFIGAVPVDLVSTAQYISTRVRLPDTKTSQVHHFYIKNDTDRPIQSGGFDMWVTPISIGPHG